MDEEINSLKANDLLLSPKYLMVRKQLGESGSTLLKETQIILSIKHGTWQTDTVRSKV